MTRRPTRIVLVDDHVLVRSGLKALLQAQPDLDVTGEASDGAAGVELTLARHPDVVLMDLDMPVLGGLEAIRRLRAAGSKAQILVVTDHDEDQLALRALRAGAAGFLLKHAAPDRLVEAVRAVASGELLLAPRRLVDTLVVEAEPALRRRFEHLTEREGDIVRHLAKGLSNAALAQCFGLSEGTIKTHVTRLLTKLGVRSRVQAVVLAYESGFVRPGHTEGIDL